MLPLVCQLAGRHLTGAVTTTPVTDFRGVELVPAAPGLVENAGEVAIQRRHWVSASEESLKLRMVSISPRLAAKHSPGE